MNQSVRYTKRSTFVIDFAASPAVYTGAGKVIKGIGSDIIFSKSMRVAGVGSTFVSGQLIFGGTSAPPNAGCRLWIFSKAVTVPADNQAFVIEYATIGKYLVGYLDFTTPITASAGATVSTYLLPATAPALPVMLFNTDSSQNLYGVLTTLAAWTPTASSQLTVDIRLIQN